MWIHVTSFLSVSIYLPGSDFVEVSTRREDCHLAFPHSVIPLQMKLKSAGQAGLRAFKKWFSRVVVVVSRDMYIYIYTKPLLGQKKGMKSYTVI